MVVVGWLLTVVVVRCLLCDVVRRMLFIVVVFFIVCCGLCVSFVLNASCRLKLGVVDARVSFLVCCCVLGVGVCV